MMNNYIFCLWCRSCSCCVSAFALTRDRTSDLPVSTFCFVAFRCWLQVWIWLFAILLQFSNSFRNLARFAFKRFVCFSYQNSICCLLVLSLVRKWSCKWVWRAGQLRLCFIVKIVCCLILLKLSWLLLQSVCDCMLDWIKSFCYWVWYFLVCF